MNADLVIIGGGPAGAGALWALGRLAPELRVILLEARPQLASGSTSASLECFRTCWPLACNQELMARSYEVFTHADDFLGAGAAAALGVRQQGYLFCGFTPAQAAVLKDDVAHLHALGLPHMDYLEGDELQQRFGWLGPRLLAAKFDPHAGWLDSNALINRMAYSHPNAQILFNAQDVRLCVQGGRIAGVESSHGMIHTPQVILANGAWAKQTGAAAGVEVPIVLRPRQSVTVHQRHAAFPVTGPMVIGLGAHIRPEAGTGAIFGWEYHWTAKHVPDDVPHGDDYLLHPAPHLDSLRDPRYPSLVAMLLGRQFWHRVGEGFNDPCYSRGVRHNIGYYVFRDHTAAYQTDAHGQRIPYESERAILDRAPDVDGLFYSVAHVGHGIMTAPAAGEVVASLVLGRTLPFPSADDFRAAVPFAAHDAAVL